MEKKILTALALIALIILYLGPIIIAGFILVGISMGIFAIYKKYPYAISHFMSIIITPLIILGWCYIGYVIYSNEYCNTYKVHFNRYKDDFGTTERKDYSFVAKTNEEAFVKVWRDFISENKKDIKSLDDFYHYSSILYIWNQSKNRQCNPSQYENIDSLIEAEKLYYRIGEIKLDLLYLTRGW